MEGDVQAGDVTEDMEGEEAEYLLHKCAQDCSNTRGNCQQCVLDLTLGKTSIRHQYMF